MSELWKQLVTRADESLAPHITLDKASLSRSTGALTVRFSSDRIVSPEERGALLREVKDAFPGAEVAVELSYPLLRSDALQHINAYRPAIASQVALESPGSLPMLLWQGADWKLDGQVLTVNVQTAAAKSFLKARGVDKLISKHMDTLFSIKCAVSVEVEGDEAARLERLALLRQAEAAAITIDTTPDKVRKKADTSTAIFGRPFNDKPTLMRELSEDTGRCTVRGEVSNFQSKDAKNGSTKIITFNMTDYTNSIYCKLFLGGKRAQGEKGVQQQFEELSGNLKAGNWITARGNYSYDTFSKEFSLVINDIVPADKPTREDNTPKKRVELHAHTMMSQFDATVSATDLIKRAAKWGMTSIAITDHGVVQSFPEAFGAAKKNGIKLLPGCEGYLIDDAPLIVEGGAGMSIDQCAFVVLDFETTGLSPTKDTIIEIGAVRIEKGVEVGEFSELIDPERQIPDKVVQLTGINQSMVRGKRTIKEALPDFVKFCEGAVLVAHNAAFDTAFLRRALLREGYDCRYPVLDTLAFARNLYPTFKNHKLGNICKQLSISLANAHRAVHDARATGLVLQRMLEELRARKHVQTLDGINAAFQTDAGGTAYHIILLAKNQQGMTNLYRLVSEGHLNYFHRTPRIPRRIIEQYREGLIIGSACEAGELYRAVVAGKDDGILEGIASFYDYLEIQPLGNNEFMVRQGEVESMEDIKNFNRKIVALGKKLGKPVCATGDVHFLEERDSIYRSIIMASRGFDDADNQPPLYFRTTEEMLNEFDYLGRETAKKVVIDDPNKIADMVEPVKIFIPHPEGKETFQPFWEDAESDLRRLTMEKAHSIYGENLPDIVQKRIDKELGAIIGYGFSTLYMIAVKLVKKSNADGYIVGSRGSVGSSYVAYLSGITEVDSLPPHYVCPACKHYEFDVPAPYSCGLDLPPKACPECGAQMDKDGFNIPFEVFLGFKGDKVPDIDLNFSGEYQPVAHAYIKELFGEECCYRAGTIGTVAEKTAYGYVLKYAEERGLSINNAEKERLAQGIVGVKRTSGQHPAGMVVVPKEYQIFQFTPIQHPADDTTSETITTHFDFGSMHDVLVKLDVLGHDDPTMLRRLQDLTGIAPQDVPLHDPEVFKKILSLFSGTSALGITVEDLGISKTGTLGVPEFGTKFVRGMLVDTKPTTMEELIRISGLSHGTDVWAGNASELVKQGVPLRECICTRDDIMNALIDMGVDPLIAFKTMESVRKGRGLTPEMESAIAAVNPPSWYIDCCKKIQYMFPKAHAVAYVTMALRIAYFKVFYPAEYYCCYLMRNKEDFNGATMTECTADELRARLRAAAEAQELTDKEDNERTVTEILLELTLRGVRIRKVDLYASNAQAFKLVDGEILPPISSLPGVGGSAADAFVAARDEGFRKEGPSFRFMSREDMLHRGVAKSTVETLYKAGCLGDMPESDQISFFDL